MPYYSRNSKDKLNTCHPDLITLFNEVIKYFDNTIIYGYRSPAIQMELFKAGRELKNDEWTITDKSKIVTYCDGYNKKSNHNHDPSMAVDAFPSPIEWNDRERAYYFAGHVLMLAKKLREDRRISHDIRWGGDWDMDTKVQDQVFMDLAHYEIVE